MGLKGWAQPARLIAASRWSTQRARLGQPARIHAASSLRRNLGHLPPSPTSTGAGISPRVDMSCNLATLTPMNVAASVGVSPSGATVPIERALGAGWQVGVGVWAGTAAIALVPWLLLVFERQPPLAKARAAVPVRALLRSQVAWSMGLYFGLQSSQAYIVTAWLSQIVVDAGADLTAGGYAVAVFASLGIPLSAAIPALLAKQSRLPAIVIGLGAFYIAGYAGLLLSPGSGVWVWAVLMGIGSGTFPLALTLIVLRARTAEGVSALSAFTQCMGYLLATIGPVAIGSLHDLTGNWTVPLIVCIAIAATMTLFGLRVAAPRVVEDDLMG